MDRSSLVVQQNTKRHDTETSFRSSWCNICGPTIICSWPKSSLPSLTMTFPITSLVKLASLLMIASCTLACALKLCLNTTLCGCHLWTSYTTPELYKLSATFNEIIDLLRDNASRLCWTTLWHWMDSYLCVGKYTWCCYWCTHAYQYAILPYLVPVFSYFIWRLEGGHKVPLHCDIFTSIAFAGTWDGTGLPVLTLLYFTGMHIICYISEYKSLCYLIRKIIKS